MPDLSGAQPARRTVLGGLGDAHQQAESFLYKRTLLAALDKVVKVVLASGILVMLEASFFIASFKRVITSFR